MTWFDVLLWAAWFSMTLGTGLLLWYRERKEERSSHDPYTCKVCVQIRHDQYISYLKSDQKDPKSRLRLVKD